MNQGSADDTMYMYLYGIRVTQDCGVTGKGVGRAKNSAIARTSAEICVQEREREFKGRYYGASPPTSRRGMINSDDTLRWYGAAA